MELLAFSKRYRVPISRLLAGGVLALVLGSRHDWPVGPAGALAIEAAAFALVVVAAFGRLWSSLYMFSRREKIMLDVGPYSVVRNPLYIFSFLGALGIGLAAGSFVVLAALALFFAGYYPWVVLGEERSLRRRYPQEYEAYAERTRRLWPKLTAFNEPETFEIRPRKFRRAMTDCMSFLGIYLLIVLAGKLQALQLLPALFRLP